MGMLRRLHGRPDWQIALAVTCALRIVFSGIAAALSFVLHPAQGLIRSNALTENLPTPGTWHYALLGVWERFDTLWYLHIAQHGYDRPDAVVFYPLYPALIRVLIPVAGGMASALLISTASSFVLFWGLLRVARTEIPERPPFRVLALFALWPTSFILFAGYTEGLAIMLVLWCIWFARSERWEASAACGFAAGLTRSMGSLLIVPLAVIACKSRRSSRWWIVLVPAGTLGYWEWLRASGRPNVAAAYSYWNTDIVAPWTTIWRAIIFLAHRPDTLVAINFGALILFTAMGMRQSRRSGDRAFSAAVILQILMRACSPPLAGTFRYVLPIYPAFLTMSAWAQGLTRSRFIFLCAALFAFNLFWMWAFLNWSLVL